MNFLSFWVNFQEIFQEGVDLSCFQNSQLVFDGDPKLVVLYPFHFCCLCKAKIT